MDNTLVRIGKIIGCHGVRGDVKVRPASENPSWAKIGVALTLKHARTGEHQQFKIASCREQGPLIVLSFQGVDNRNAVEPLVGSTLFTKRDALTPPDEGEFWADDLIGLSVVDLQTGRTTGIVKDLLSATGSDFLEIQLENSEQTVVIPFIDHFFPKVDLQNKTISVDLLSDFLSISSEPVTADRLEQ